MEQNQFQNSEIEVLWRPQNWKFYFFCNWLPVLMREPLNQGCPNLVLKGHCPAEFSSYMPQHTCLEVSRMPSKSLMSWFRCVWLVLELNSVGPSLDTPDLNQGASALYLEIHFPAEFSSNHNQTLLNNLIKVFKITTKLKVGVFNPVWRLVCRKVDLKVQSLGSLH